MSKEIDAAVTTALNTMGVTYISRYRGECDAPWRSDGKQKTRMDRYEVSINTYTTDFYQGLGHRKAIRPMPTPPYRKGTLAYEQWEKLSTKPVAPTAAKVLSCLLSDAEAIDMSFSDWASGFGYDTDSIKALTTYNKCCETGNDLRKIFTFSQREELRKLLEDY